MPSLVFWFEFASTYSCPATCRIDALAARAGCEVHYRPFLLGPIFAAQGMNDSPFNLYPAKGRYMWRDLERVCAALELPFRRPSVFPRNGLLAARVATVAEPAWVGTFARRVYAENFAHDRDIADPAVVRGCLDGLVDDPEATLQAAVSQDNKARLRARTEEAMTRGLFGAPTCTVGDELFWGNDRLEAAIAAATAS